MAIHIGQRLSCPLGIARSVWPAISSKRIAPRVPNDNSFIDQTYFVTMPVSSHFDLMFGRITLFVVWRSQRLGVIIQFRQNNLFRTSTVMQFVLDENISCDVPHNFCSPFDNNFTIFPQKQQLNVIRKCSLPRAGNTREQGVRKTKTHCYICGYCSH